MPDVKPTPTQGENDRAASGEHVIVKSPDGSDIDQGAKPPEGGFAGEMPELPPTEPEPEPPTEPEPEPEPEPQARPSSLTDTR